MRSLIVVLGLTGLVMAGAGAASAEPPVTVSDPITDEVGALGGDEPAVRAAIDELAAESEIALYAVLVSSFDSEGEADWVEQTARLSQLEGSDILLTVAVGDDAYEYGWWVDDGFPLSEIEVEDVINSEVVPELDTENWDAGVITLADQLRSMSVSAEEEAQTSSWSASTTMLVVGGFAVVLLGAHLFSRRRTPAGSPR